MKSTNDTGAPLSTAFFNAWADSSIECIPKITIEFGNNAFNSSNSVNQVITSSSEKLAKIFDQGGLLINTLHFWEPVQAFNNRDRNSMRWAVLDQGAKAWGPTSSYDPYRTVNIKDIGEQYEHGWWSNNKSDGSGNFGSAEWVQSIFTAARNINKVTLYTDEAYPNMKQISIEYYNGSSWIAIPGATSVTLASGTYINSYSFDTLLVSGLRVFINSTYAINSHARISELQGLLIEDVSADIVSLQVDETREQYDTTVPIGVLKTASCSGVVQNVDQKFSAANSSSPYYPYIGENNRVVVALGVDTTRFGGSGFEYVNMGEYFVDQWNIDGAAVTATFEGRDYGKFLQDQVVPFSKVWLNTTVNIPFRDLLERSGKCPSQINIDPLALRTFPLLYVFNTSYWNFMAEVALADQGTFGFDGNGNFFYYTFTQLSNPPYDTSMFTLDQNTNIIDGTQTTNLEINIVLVDVHPLVSGDLGLQALFTESNTRSIKSTVITSIVTEETAASTLSWNHLASSIDATVLTIPVTLDNATQDLMSETAFGAIEVPTIGDFYFLIDNELIYCTSLDHTHLYVYPGNPLESVGPDNPTGRGWAGTQAASHTTPKYIGEAEYFESVDFKVQPALMVTGVHSTAIDDTPLITGIAQAKLVKFNYDAFQAELCIANQVPTFTPLVGSGLPPADPAKLFTGHEGIDAIDTNLTFDWKTTINGIALLQRSTPRKAGTANLTNKRLIRRHGKKEIEINNPWIQSQAHANQITQFMIQQFNVPRTMLNLRTIGLPFLDLSDRITISSFPEIGITSRDFNIFNISYTFDGSLIATLSLREVL